MRKIAILAQSMRPRAAALKARAVFAVGLASLLGGVAAFGTVTETRAPIAREIVVEALPLELPPPVTAAVEVYWHETRLERSDTFAKLLERLGVDSAETRKLLIENGGTKPFRNLRPGMAVRAQITDYGALMSLRFMSGRDTLLGFDREGDRFIAIEQEPELVRQVFMKKGVIESSLFAATDEVDLPDSIATQIADVFAGDVDFHRDLRRGDRFAVVYEVLYHEGRPFRAGRVLAAEFVNAGRAYRAVWFADEGGDKKSGYYAPDGNNMRKAFLRSPLEFSRITSGFAMRFHPILKEWRAHKGVDYGAPSGTRVRATADGRVEFAGSKGGYGNVLILRHNGGITTLYAHLRGFASDVRRGARVAQGDTIGYVGATGWATGPHLHYEFRVNDAHRNPLTIAMPAAEPVAPDRMGAFKAVADPLVAQLQLLENINLAVLE